MKSFVDTVNKVCDIPTSQLSQLVIEGDIIAITISKDEYKARIKGCKLNLHGRNSPLKISVLRSNLTPLWQYLSKWSIISLEGGFYDISFSSLEDSQKFQSMGVWNLNPSYIQVFVQTKDFNPNAQSHTSTQVWLKTYGLDFRLKYLISDFKYKRRR